MKDRFPRNTNISTCLINPKVLTASYSHILAVENQDTKNDEEMFDY